MFTMQYVVELTQSGRTNRYMGLYTESFNPHITNCELIQEVDLCYEWWDGESLAECLIAVDADGNTSFTNVTTMCPNVTSNPGLTCTDITSLESWTCNNFFGTNGTKSVAATQFRTTGTSAPIEIFSDALYFNVTYY